MPQPVLALARRSLDLRAEMAQCAADPTPKSVHRLRSNLRRIEATFELLLAAADAPDLPARQRAFRRSIRNLRREAGEVRDLDVHLEALAALRKSDGVEELARKLSRARDKSLKKLRQCVKRDGHKIHQKLDRLEAALAPVTDLSLSGQTLVQVAQDWLKPKLRGLHPDEDEDLHAIRKVCKTARYIAEIGGETSRSAAALARRLSGIQQTTGTWHDALLLLDRAERTVPDDSALLAKLRAAATTFRRQAEIKARRILAT